MAIARMKLRIAAIFKTEALFELNMRNSLPNSNAVNFGRLLSRPFDQLREFIEKIGGIVRTRRCLGVILHAEDRQLLVAHSFYRLMDRPQTRDFAR